MGITRFHAKYFAFELTKRCSSDNIQKLASTLVDAQVDLNPHQVEAALFAFRSPLSKGAILADEVGLGKTIEAGLVISQKWAERKKRILIITPSNLRKQWSQELLDKFFLPSVILETKSFNDCIKKKNLNPFLQDSIILCSYQFARTKESYIQSVNWDLVVIDEAHRLRNVYKSSNKIGNSIKNSLQERNKILLTATPLQNSLLELYGLVSIIDDYAFGDLKSFRSQYSRVNNGTDENTYNDLKERLKPICKRTLRRQVLEYIKYTNRTAIVEEFYPTEDEQRLYDLVSEYLQRPNLFALPPSQRQLMTLILRKLLASSTFAISGTLEGLAGKLETIIENHENPIPFAETIAADFETFDELKDEWTDDEYGIDESVRQYTDEEIEEIKTEIENLKEFEKLAKSIEKNSKGEKLITALEAAFAKATELGAARKAIIFTESTRTQVYLKFILESKGYTGKIVLFNGSNNDPESKQIYKNWITRYKDTDRITGSKTADMRAALVDCFRDEAAIMIATEAAAEGINLQFCSLVVNYDMPWNPQRIEQRIGRCHRYGQKYDVVVVNFLNKANAADVRVYELLQDKFNLFSGVFGTSDEVLGSIENGVDFEKRIAQIYQECRTLETIQASFDELQRELETQISSEMKQTRQKLLENFDEEVHDKLRISFDESREYRSKYEQWLWQLTQYYLKDYADFSESEYSFTLKENPFPDEKIHSGPYRIGKNIEDANIYRIHHPLASKIITECRSLQLNEKELIFDYSGCIKKITILESLVGKSGWLMATSLSITSFDAEDYVVLSGITEKGEQMGADQCQRLFSLPAIETELAKVADFEGTRKVLKNHYEKVKSGIIDDISIRNGSYFEVELEKLDKWGDDKRSSLKLTLKELDDLIKELKKQVRLAPNLPEKLKLEKDKRKLETDRDEAWKEYDNSAKEIEKNKDKLIDEIEIKLKQKLTEKTLFMIKWKLQ